MFFILLTLSILGIASDLSSIVPRGVSIAIELRKVFSDSRFRVNRRALYQPGAFFGPDDRQVYYISGVDGTVVVLDWKTNVLVRKMNYRERFSSHPILGNTECRVTALKFLPGTQYALVRYCSSVILVDAKSLEVEKVLILKTEDIVVRARTYSPVLEYLAIYWNTPKINKFWVRVYDAKDWQVVSEWPIRFMWDVAFTPDGRYLAGVYYERRREPEGTTRTCGGELREIPLGTVISDWKLPRREDITCPTEIQFLPGSDYQFASVSPPFDRIGIWSARDGRLVRQILNDRNVRSGGNWELSPDGRWIVGSLRDDPEDAPKGQQDFKIWNAQTGKVVYETPLQKWKLFSRKKQMTPIYFHFSSDGRYLVMINDKELAIYEIIEKP